jgi:hypothetical protein
VAAPQLLRLWSGLLSVAMGMKDIDHSPSCEAGDAQEDTCRLRRFRIVSTWPPPFYEPKDSFLHRVRILPPPFGGADEYQGKSSFLFTGAKERLRLCLGRSTSSLWKRPLIERPPQIA